MGISRISSISRISRTSRIEIQVLRNTLIFLLLIQTNVSCYQFKVGDLSAWGIPSSSNPTIYTKWSKNHIFKLGDSLLFLYPPSEDSVIQITEESYKTCNTKDPILYMNNGNSLFNITAHGEFYFTSGTQGNCHKSQKLQISVSSGNGSSASPPSYGADSLPDISPSYPTNFGSIPAASSSSPSLKVPGFVSLITGFLICVLLRM